MEAKLGQPPLVATKELFALDGAVLAHGARAPFPLPHDFMPWDLRMVPWTVVRVLDGIDDGSAGTRPRWPRWRSDPPDSGSRPGDSSRPTTKAGRLESGHAPGSRVNLAQTMAARRFRPG